MTIEEIIEKHLGWSKVNIESDIILLCQEVRRLTIEECKEKSKVVKFNWDSNQYISLEAFDDKDNSYYVDRKSFPTDLNNIDI